MWHEHLPYFPPFLLKVLLALGAGLAIAALL
ncbi:MAG: hypothetical protein JWQ83_713 [Lacunisphaera sp.]|nr:hypothetical protein [Lacunisphaera sp.]